MGYAIKHYDGTCTASSCYRHLHCHDTYHIPLYACTSISRMTLASVPDTPLTAAAWPHYRRQPCGLSQPIYSSSLLLRCGSGAHKRLNAGTLLPPVRLSRGVPAAATTISLHVDCWMVVLIRMLPHDGLLLSPHAPAGLRASTTAPLTRDGRCAIVISWDHLLPFDTISYQTASGAFAGPPYACRVVVNNGIDNARDTGALPTPSTHRLLLPPPFFSLLYLLSRHLWQYPLAGSGMPGSHFRGKDG